MTRVAIITNEPPPYRIPVFQRVARTSGIVLQVIFCTRRDGLNPTQLYTFAYCWLKGIPHVPLTDGTDLSEQGLSRVHKSIRRIVYKRSKAFLAASAGGLRLFETYGVAPERCFRSCLCIDNDAYLHAPEPPGEKFDLIFCGRMEAVKGPAFALEVAAKLADRLGRKISILFVGSGSQQEQVRASARRLDLVDARFHGFALQGDLPSLYRSAKVFLFPTQWDPWGVVANEACAAGLPVIVSPHAGVAGELVLNGENGFVCELDSDLWAERAATLLSDEDRWEKFSRGSLAVVRDYSFDSAARGLIDACRTALEERAPDELSRPI
jgi:glycosyltransferase involved in cell wall biosynthesis